MWDYCILSSIVGVTSQKRPWLILYSHLFGGEGDFIKLASEDDCDLLADSYEQNSFSHTQISGYIDCNDIDYVPWTQCQFLVITSIEFLHDDLSLTWCFRYSSDEPITTVTEPIHITACHPSLLFLPLFSALELFPKI